MRRALPATGAEMIGLRQSGVKRRAERAIARQLGYQRQKAASIVGHEAAIMVLKSEETRRVRARLEAVRPIRGEERVLEVGSGAHGHIFFFGTSNGVGVDPLADHYAGLFPAWQGRARTVAAGGEELPFDDSSFDIVLCDNVVDHAESPRRILCEIARVLRPGGLLYFTVNVHHPVYHVAASVHAAWRAIGVPFEIGPFADHTVHLTPPAARKLFDALPLRMISERQDRARLESGGGIARPRHLGDRLKRLFYKNALYEVIAERR